MRNSAIGCACLLAVFEGVGIAMQRMFAPPPMVLSPFRQVLTGLGCGIPSTCASIIYIPRLSLTSFEVAVGVCRVMFWVYCTVMKHCVGSRAINVLDELRYYYYVWIMACLQALYRPDRIGSSFSSLSMRSVISALLGWPVTRDRASLYTASECRHPSVSREHEWRTF